MEATIFSENSNFEFPRIKSREGGGGGGGVFHPTGNYGN